jgi:hypothetical protein
MQAQHSSVTVSRKIWRGQFTNTSMAVSASEQPSGSDARNPLKSRVSAPSGALIHYCVRHGRHPPLITMEKPRVMTQPESV